MSARNKRQLIGGLIGASIRFAAYALVFRKDGDGTNGLLLSFGLIVGGLPGFVGWGADRDTDRGAGQFVLW